jgi:HTH-type transcriptional regulator/antitoxin HigA
MPTATKRADRGRLPRRFEDLVRRMPPQAILDDVHYENTLEMIDRLMTAGRLTAGQALYQETLVQLVQSFEAERCSIETSDLGGLDSLRHLMEENHMNGSDLARLLGVHPSMGSKILKGERSLTVDHLRRLSEHFKVSPALFIR